MYKKGSSRREASVKVSFMAGSIREDKLIALNNAVSTIEKNFGKGSIMKLGDAGNNIGIKDIT